MPPTLDYHRPTRTRPAVRWYRTNVFTTALTALFILAANLYMVGDGNKGWGFWAWAFFLAPLGNAVIAAVSLAFVPLVRHLTGASAAAHVRVTLYGCFAASILDALFILAHAHGC
jgi:hypothetical protein